MYIEGEVWQEPLQEKQGYTVLKMYTILIQQYDNKAGFKMTTALQKHLGNFTFLGCPSCISMTKECYKIGFLN